MGRTRSWLGVVLFVLAGSFLQACVIVGDILHGTRDRIVFSHKEHIDPKVSGHAAEQKMCAECHFVTPSDPRGEEIALPLEASCLKCHGEWKTKNECSKCHTDPGTPLTYKPLEHPKIFFSHARHLERTERLEEKACDSCHANTWTEGSDSGGVRLNEDREERWHQVCFKCHLMRTEWEKMNCQKCHAQISDRDGPRPLSRFHHDGSWLQQHGDQLIGRPEGIALCAKCHDRGYCSDCHDARDERRVRPEIKFPERPDRQFIHRGDYVNRHAFEARANPADCIRCHAVQSFCRTCHEQRGLSEGTRLELTQTPGATDRNLFLKQGGVVPLLQYHNGDYASFMNPSSSSFHGRTARRDAVLCATCHDYGKESVCIDCHADPQVKTPRINGGNPHPKGFRSAIPKSAKPCSYCHLTDAGR